MHSSGDTSALFRGNGSIGNRVLVNSSSPIHAATPPVTQQPIISMEDDEISDQEIVSKFCWQCYLYMLLFCEHFRGEPYTGRYAK